MLDRRILAALALLCVVSDATAARPRYTPSTGLSGLYGCADGRMIEVLYSGGDAAVLTIGDRTIQMQRASADDGERYVGGAWQWWGRETRAGMLSSVRAGDGASATAGVACHLR